MLLCARCGLQCNELWWTHLTCTICNSTAHTHCLQLPPNSYLAQNFTCDECQHTNSSSLSSLARHYQAKLRIIAAAPGQPSTLSAYRSSLHQLFLFCANHLSMSFDDIFPKNPKEQMPTQPLLLFLLHRRSTIASTAVDKAAIAFWHRQRGLDDPTKALEEAAIIRAVNRQVAHVQGTGQKAPISPAQLKDMLSILADELQNPHSPTQWLARRDGALLTTGFGALLRASEIAALRNSDIVFVSRGQEDAQMEIHIRKSKTDPTSKGQTVVIATPPGSPFRTDWWMINILTDNKTRGQTAETPAFPRSAGIHNPLSKREVAQIVRNRVLQWANLRKVAINATAYAGHSLRRGGATAMAEAGISGREIQRQGRWKSEAFMRYIEASETTIRAASASWQT